MQARKLGHALGQVLLGHDRVAPIDGLGSAAGVGARHSGTRSAGSRGASGAHAGDAPGLSPRLSPTRVGGPGTEISSLPQPVPRFKTAIKGVSRDCFKANFAYKSRPRRAERLTRATKLVRARDWIASSVVVLHGQANSAQAGGGRAPKLGLCYALPAYHWACRAGASGRPDLVASGSFAARPTA